MALMSGMNEGPERTSTSSPPGRFGFFLWEQMDGIEHFLRLKGRRIPLPLRNQLHLALCGAGLPCPVFPDIFMDS
jgi:hypothetical protein